MPFCEPVPSFIALSSFLRGIEQRALVFAQAQCGNTAIAQVALNTTITQFTETAITQPLSAWPTHFWSLLLARPELLTHAPLRGPLKMLSAGPRAALLLRLVAGLDIAGVAHILKVRESVSRLALDRALSQLQAGGVSGQELQRLQQLLHARVRQSGAGQKQALNALRERLLPPALASATPAKKMRWLGFAWVLLALLMLALVATFIWPLPSRLKPHQTRELPLSVKHSPRVYDDAAMVMHPDYAQLASSLDPTLTHELPMLSWLAADSADTPSSNTPRVLEEVVTPSAQPETETTP